MSYAAITYLCLIALGLGVSMSNHGKPRSNTNFFIDVVSTGIVVSILYWGGFFS